MNTHTCVWESTFPILPRNSNYFFSSEAHFPANVFYEITLITDALKKNAHDQNEQTITAIIELNICTLEIAGIVSFLSRLYVKAYWFLVSKVHFLFPLELPFVLKSRKSVQMIKMCFSISF